MLAFPSMIEPCAEKAGLLVPPDLDEYDAAKFPHWYVFCAVQLGAAMPHPSAHWDNAEVIATFDDAGIRAATYDDLVKAGLSVGNSSMYA